MGLAVVTSSGWDPDKWAWLNRDNVTRLIAARAQSQEVPPGGYRNNESSRLLLISAGI